MSQYTPTSGTILQIEWQSADPDQMGCALNVTFQSMDQGLIHMIVDGTTYVMNSCPLRAGDQVTFFYLTDAPVPLIYPPQYRAAAAVHTPSGTYAALDVFTQSSYNGQLTNSDDTLRLNLSSNTALMLANGQPFGGTLSGKLLLVIYSATTRSIPAQTTPEKIVVFCDDGSAES